MMTDRIAVEPDAADFITDVDDAYEYRDRAHAAEQEIDNIRASIRDLIAWLRQPTLGKVVYRSDVVEHLNRIRDW